MASAIESDSRPKREVTERGSDEPEEAGLESAGVASSDRKTEAADKAQAERKRLLLAAREVLQRSGWWGFKVESVLRQAGLSTRSFYRHFDKKTDLLLALLELELGGAGVNLRRVIDAADTPSDKVRAYVTATIDMAYRADLAKPSSLFASHWRELLPEYPEEIESCLKGMTAPLVEAIEAGVAHGEFHSEDPVADARAIFYLVAGMTADQAAMGGATPREEIEHIAIPFISHAIGMR